jgi:hypothetical protein
MVFDNFIDRILCVAGAVLFSQAPEFMQQYLQRLGGHLDEARRQLALFERTAAESGLPLREFIQRTAASAEPSVAKLASVITESSERVSTLQAAHDALLHASLWERPFVFLRHLDVSIAKATAIIYRPAVPTTAEGLLYALVGMLLLLALYHLALKRLVASLGRSRQPARAAA